MGQKKTNIGKELDTTLNALKDEETGLVDPEVDEDVADIPDMADAEDAPEDDTEADKAKEEVKKPKKAKAKKPRSKTSPKLKFIKKIDFSSKAAIDVAFKIFYQPGEKNRIERNVSAINNIIKRFNTTLEIPTYREIVLSHTMSVLEKISEDDVDVSWLDKEPAQYFKTIVQNANSRLSKKV